MLLHLYNSFNNIDSLFLLQLYKLYSAENAYRTLLSLQKYFFFIDWHSNNICNINRRKLLASLYDICETYMENKHFNNSYNHKVLDIETFAP